MRQERVTSLGKISVVVVDAVDAQDAVEQNQADQSGEKGQSAGKNSPTTVVVRQIGAGENHFRNGTQQEHGGGDSKCFVFVVVSFTKRKVQDGLLAHHRSQDRIDE